VTAMQKDERESCCRRRFAAGRGPVVALDESPGRSDGVLVLGLADALLVDHHCNTSSSRCCGQSQVAVCGGGVGDVSAQFEFIPPS